MDNSICLNCRHINDCQWFINILKHDEIENKKHGTTWNYEYQTMTIVYDCHKYEKK